MKLGITGSRTITQFDFMPYFMMEDKDFSLQQEDKEKIETSVKLHTPLEITTYTLPKNMEVYHEFLTR